MMRARKTRAPSLRDATPSSAFKSEVVAPRKVAKVSIYLYVVVMGLLFANQTYLSVSKYLNKEVSTLSCCVVDCSILLPHIRTYTLLQIVEDVSMTRNRTAVMPPLTFCLLPGYTKAMNVQEMQNFSTFCPDQPDIIKCVEDIK